MSPSPTLGAVVAASLVLVACAPAPQHPAQLYDQPLRAEIDRIQAIDGHAHPARVTNEGEQDTDADLLPLDAMVPFRLPARIEASNPEYRGAWEALFGYKGSDPKRAAQAKARDMRENGDTYPVRILDHLGIETMLANRVALGRGLPSGRFRWVPFADPLMYPLSNQSLSSRDPDRKTFFAAEEKVLRRFLAETGRQSLPGRFDDYLAFATETVERHKKGGAVAEKFEVAYLRSFNFGNPSKADAERVFAKYAAGGVPPDDEYKTVQDFLFRHIAADCGRLGLPVHIHSSTGAGSYFDVAGTNPLLLEPVLNDPSLRRTQFVLIHGGWPFTQEAQALLLKPNLWIDMSLITLLLPPRELASILRGWLSFMPDRIMFGTDASPMGPDVGWEESAWLSNRSARDAIAIALTGMVRDREIPRDRAIDLARMVLRDNARALYGWK